MNAVCVNLLDPRQALEAVLARLEEKRAFTLFTLNLDHVVKLRTSAEFRACYADADFVSADGWPIVRYLRKRGAAAVRTTGADLTLPLCEAAARAGVGVFIIGPRAPVQDRAVDKLRETIPRLDIAGTDASIVDPRNAAALDELARRLRASGARLCFVCLGAPKQEMTAQALKARCPGVGFICVGAALDFISGDVVRAPRFVQKIGMEWAWRLASDPWRLAPRYMRCAEVFVLIALHRLPLVLRAQPAATFAGGRNVGSLRG
ncbi:MAG: WecB/TagA/CpsF family glycosyltransferase [Rhodoblastus sp.]